MTRITVVVAQHLPTVLALSAHFLHSHTSTESYLNAKTVHARHVLHRVAIYLVCARLVVAKAACEELMALRAHHLCCSSVMGTAQNALFLVLRHYNTPLNSHMPSHLRSINRPIFNIDVSDVVLHRISPPPVLLVDEFEGHHGLREQKHVHSIRTWICLFFSISFTPLRMMRITISLFTFYS